MYNSQNQRTKLEMLRNQLKNERSTFEPHWRDLGDYILPRRTRFFTQDVNRGDRRNQKIIDSTATLASRTLRSGMMSGITSPARPWFRLSTPDPDLAAFAPVKAWLHLTRERMTAEFLRSNLYQKLPSLYGDLGVFGTAALSVEEDFNNLIRCQSFPIGSFYLMTDFTGRVNGFVHEFQMTVKQIVDQYGRNDGTTGKADWSNISDYVRGQYETGNYHTWVEVVHVIMPNEDYDPNKPLSKNKKFKSCHYERGTVGTQNYMSSNDNRILREGGFDVFPIMAPRWEVTGEDAYATDCPGMTALGDIKALQLMHKRKSQAIEKMVNPPMVGPTSLMNSKSSILPGDITYLDSRDAGAFRPAHEINFRIGELMQDINEHQYRIKRSFYEDLFLMFTDTDRKQITATEINSREQEKLLAIGPVLEQLNQDLLDPLIDTTFEYMVKQGKLPPPPEDLQGVPLKVEYVSIMAQAQKLVGISGVERFTSYIGAVAQYDQRVLEKFNAFEAINIYADMTSVPPNLVVPDDVAKKSIAQKQQAQEQQAQMEQMKMAAESAQKLSQTNTQEQNGLTDVIGLLTGQGQ